MKKIFRIWNKDTKQWLKDEISLHCFCNYFLDDNGKVFCLTTSERGMGIQEMENVVVQMASGIRDKSGNMIYDGDIVVFSEYCGGVHLVKFDEILSASFLVSDEPWPDDDLIIVGNIFEKPELLTN